MNSVQANLFVVARISSVKVSTTVRFDERRPASPPPDPAPPNPPPDPNYLLLGLYSSQAPYRQLMHDGWLSTPQRLRVSTGINPQPTYQQAHTAAANRLALTFPGTTLEAQPSSLSYWTGTYWIRPTPAQFSFGFRFLDANGVAVQGNLGMNDINGVPSLLRLDFLAVVQSRN